MKKGYITSPIGFVEIVEVEGFIVSIAFVEEQGIEENSSVLRETKKQLEEYFRGERKIFDFPLLVEGTPFQESVWKELQKIPYGECSTYGRIAMNLQKDKAVRAVGAANKRNPIGIVIPCHRCTGKDGKKPGYNGGLWRMEWLLEHEQKYK